MDLYVATSRGRELEEQFRNHPNSIFKFFPGATYDRLLREAVKTIREKKEEDIIIDMVYFVGGLPDTTCRIKIDEEQYEEVIYNGIPYNTALSTTSSINICSKKIKSLNATPVFATISPIDLHTWNHHRLLNQYTSYIIHFPYYEDMQSLHNDTIIGLNRKIIEINKSNNVHTPKLASQIIQKKGNGRSYRTRFHRLRDGCHPRESVIRDWADELMGTAIRNRYLMK